MPAVPIYVKGGVWSTVEDEILRAAVQRYGTHAWNKVASLLPRKSGKQCRARWEESVRPTRQGAWTAAEDATLAALARGGPQWRSVGAALGRPAAACAARWAELTGDQAVAGPAAGERIPGAEGLPAVPEEDEREMVAEARARLASTQGKKAARRARERQVEESRRVARLQKRRALLQAGVNSALPLPRAVRGQLDPNADVLYELAPAEGVFETANEAARDRAAREAYERQIEARGKRTARKQSRAPARAPATEQPALQVRRAIPRPPLELPVPEALLKNSAAPTAAVRRALARLWQGLPAAKNDFDVAPESEDEQPSGSADAAVQSTDMEVLLPWEPPLRQDLPPPPPPPPGLLAEHYRALAAAAAGGPACYDTPDVLRQREAIERALAAEPSPAMLHPQCELPRLPSLDALRAAAQPRPQRRLAAHAATDAGSRLLAYELLPDLATKQREYYVRYTAYELERTAVATRVRRLTAGR
ncbi:AER344Wp [Eremothecium gossypii ATCC 10895]|uniref:Pre-mRNA-splicing factor CEF1 n=1 Tax=Eremothecium gossypii (strain ATCC 10895 / CBS 109.51 / FGSC 9923 / NRRL Y-1056) TaxID=284811 RepID=CEF1_EREGS|nr:AER344Wp [Eremothecium gossypii ATCC 10895]Q756C3.1 RecName: Full=Pre-mRNA-splicing factor CEF1 [Eremothecium gossypii ATCC 10895]AAS53024.1 AER344Wp [Eremothecium gossypii ATCC 10895]